MITAAMAGNRNSFLTSALPSPCSKVLFYGQLASKGVKFAICATDISIPSTKISSLPLLPQGHGPTAGDGAGQTQKFV